MREKLLERLKLIEEAVAEKGKEMQQANADFNALSGARNEIIHLLNAEDNKPD